MTDLSIVVPAYNEQENISVLHHRLTEALRGKSYEILFVDDGSTDKTLEVCEKLHCEDKHVKVIQFRRNFGQTAAFDAGFKRAQGKVIITIDADLQNDPHDIDLLLKKLDEGYDCVSGWRINRKDSIGKTITSLFANGFRKLLTGEKIHDSGCSLKAYRKECVENVDLYGETHRFIPTILSWKGFKVGEVKVKHYPRAFGKTKYGFSRVFRGLFDFIVIKFWMNYSTKPMYFLGPVGLVLTFFGSLIGGYLTFDKIFFGASLANRPLLLLAILLVILGVQFLIFGIILDILVKIYYENRTKTYYSIKKVLQ